MTVLAKEAAFYVNKIMDDRCVLVASSKDHDASIMTAIVDVLEDAVLSDYSGAKKVDDLIRKSQAIDFSTKIDGLNIHFSSGPVEDTVHEGRPAFSIKMPRAINRVQRREFYRATTPVTERPECFVERNGKRHMATVIDISIGGIGAIVENAFFKTGDVIEKCRINTPVRMPIEASLEIVRVGYKLDNGNGTRYGCRFKGMSRSIEANLYRYGAYLQGLEIARRRELIE